VYRYSAFGGKAEVTVNSSSFAARNPYRFSTKYLDAEVETTEGTYYYGYRHYATALGRWLSRDPIGERGGVNLYGMCYNNAVSWYDVLGRDPAGGPARAPQKPLNPRTDGKVQPGPNPPSDCAGHACGSKDQTGFNPENKAGDGEIDCKDPCPAGKIKVKLYYPQDGGKNDDQDNEPPFHAVGQQPDGKWTSQDGEGGNVYNDITNPDIHTDGYYCQLHPENCKGMLAPPRIEAPKMITRCTCVCPSK
jgi:RHS repeat-associated protein